MQRYNPRDIESKWQKFWDETGVYTADLNSKKPKYLAMSMFNYPSGAGIHIGHAMNYTISDVKARFKRQQGYESYHPVGWDAFGLPAENYAIKAGVSPQESMANIIPGYHKQYKAMGWSNDWEKEISTHLPEYYKWTQWIFSEMYKKGLAYQDSRMQWWCPIDNTVLANEQVIDGKCWRHDGPNDPPVEKKEVKQWFFKITEYADELLEATDSLDWTESVKLAQKNWIGKSKGAEIDFGLDFGDEAINSRRDAEGKKAHITVFTTRPDTIYGVTYLVLAPEHKWVELALDHKTVLKNNDEVAEYVEKSKHKSEIERQENKQKTGVKLEGVEAINPVNGERIPMFIADYVLPGYGTGAIMAVPAHDERDFEFAQKFNLPIIEVIEASTFDNDNPPQEGKKNTKRNVVICVVKNSEGKYLTLKWNKLDWHNFVMGGIEKGEEIIEAAKREITEETGYTDFEFKGRMPFALNSIFYAAHKDVNRDIRVDIVLFELKSDKKQSTKLEAHEDFKPVWIEKGDLKNLHPVGGLDYIVRWVEEGDYAYSGEGRVINSGDYSGMSSSEVREKIVTSLTNKGLAKEKVNFRMRDWSVSRQRYWGAPIPIINCQKCGSQLVPAENLPVVLPELTDFKPAGDGRSALARAKDWLKVKCPKCGNQAERETDTLDTYIDSSWYMYRYMDPHNQEAIFDKKIAQKWEPIDFYNGADHATAHLLYARFIARFFTKIGLINEPEPFKKFLFNGKVTAQDGTMFSKSKGNGVDPLEIIDQGYGADALRTYLMFAAPLELWARWDPQGVPGTYRFLSRLWNLVQEYKEASGKEADKNLQQALLASNARMVKKMTEDIENNRYNTAIAAAMEQLNNLYKLKQKSLSKNLAWQEAIENIVICIAPFAPHISEELWQQLGHSGSIHRDSWPLVDEKQLAQTHVTVAVQVNGKVRATLQLAPKETEKEALAAAMANKKVAPYLANKTLHKTIYVPGKIINLVIS